MSTKKSLVIEWIRMITPAPFGNASVIEQSLGLNKHIDGKPIKIFFDADQRFIRVECESGGTDLVPIANIASIRVKYAD